MYNSISDFNNVFFIGVAGTGMSALAQFLAGSGKNVSGSDRYFIKNKENETRYKLEAAGVKCFEQDGSGINEQTQLVVVSTAIEDSIKEVQLARQLNIQIIKRSDLLSLIAKSKKTVAVGGTSGKSSVCAMLFQILQHAKLDAGIISGAGLINLIKKGKIGNAHVGKGEWLIIEADESDGSIVKYTPDIGVLLNIDKDHQEMDELISIFTIFKNNSHQFIVNTSHPFSKQIGGKGNYDFSVNGDAPVNAEHFKQIDVTIHFRIANVPFQLNAAGAHNMENATAATAIALSLGISLQTCANALLNYEGIYRRHQVIGKKNNIWLIDDYAHNPVKCAASIKACQPITNKIIAWFQPHGYGPTKFLRNDFVKEIANALREEDEIWMSEIFYAGGTAVKDISANDLIKDLKACGKHANFVEDRNRFIAAARENIIPGSVVLLMGARDPSLENFADQVYKEL